MRDYTDYYSCPSADAGVTASPEYSEMASSAYGMDSSQAECQCDLLRQTAELVDQKVATENLIFYRSIEIGTDAIASVDNMERSVATGEDMLIDYLDSLKPSTSDASSETDESLLLDLLATLKPKTTDLQIETDPIKLLDFTTSTDDSLLKSLFDDLRPFTDETASQTFITTFEIEPQEYVDIKPVSCQSVDIQTLYELADAECQAKPSYEDAICAVEFFVSDATTQTFERTMSDMSTDSVDLKRLVARKVSAKPDTRERGSDNCAFDLTELKRKKPAPSPLADRKPKWNI